MAEIITVGDLLESLEKLPKHLRIVYSKDDEGNSYHFSYFTATFGRYDKEGHSFISQEELNNIKNKKEKDKIDEQLIEEFKDGLPVVCIN